MRALLLLPLAAALAGCGLLTLPTGVPPVPAAVANTTVLDEQAALGVELAYKAERIALETAVDAERLTGARATQAAALDDKAFAAVKIARRAYLAGNATDYVTAIAQARLAVADTLALLEPHP